MRKIGKSLLGIYTNPYSNPSFLGGNYICLLQTSQRNAYQLEPRQWTASKSQSGMWRVYGTIHHPGTHSCPRSSWCQTMQRPSSYNTFLAYFLFSSLSTTVFKSSSNCHGLIWIMSLISANTYIVYPFANHFFVEKRLNW